MTAWDRLVQWQSDETRQLSFETECVTVYGNSQVTLILHDEEGTVTESGNASDFDFTVYRALWRWGHDGGYDKEPT